MSRREPTVINCWANQSQSVIDAFVAFYETLKKLHKKFKKKQKYHSIFRQEFKISMESLLTELTNEDPPIPEKLASIFTALQMGLTKLAANKSGRADLQTFMELTSLLSQHLSKLRTAMEGTIRSPFTPLNSESSRQSLRIVFQFTPYTVAQIKFFIESMSAPIDPPSRLNSLRRFTGDYPIFTILLSASAGVVGGFAGCHGVEALANVLNNDQNGRDFGVALAFLILLIVIASGNLVLNVHDRYERSKQNQARLTDSSQRLINGINGDSSDDEGSHEELRL